MGRTFHPDRCCRYQHDWNRADVPDLSRLRCPRWAWDEWLPPAGLQDRRIVLRDEAGTGNIVVPRWWERWRCDGATSGDVLRSHVRNRRNTWNAPFRHSHRRGALVCASKVDRNACGRVRGQDRTRTPDPSAGGNCSVEPNAKIHCVGIPDCGRCGAVDHFKQPKQLHSALLRARRPRIRGVRKPGPFNHVAHRRGSDAVGRVPC